jgi:uncharacterized protein (TIGR03382 family)
MTRKLNQTLFAGMSAFLAAAAFGAVAQADITIGTAQVLTVNKATDDDKARVQIPQGGTAQDAYLRKTDEEFTNEMHTVALAGKYGVSVEMRSSSLLINGTLTKPPGNGQRMQGACAPIELVQGAGGVVEAKKNPGERWLTANNGNEYRNFNHAEAFTISEATATQPALFLIKYNAQIDGNDTKAYNVVVDQNCNIIPTTGGQANQPAPTAANPGVVVMAKNNDDCYMAQDGRSGTLYKRGVDDVQYVGYAGCNGNGRDDGWALSYSVKVTRDAAGKATGARITKHGDVSINAQEERGRGTCAQIASDKNFAACVFTSGNNQPQREGTWMTGLDITPGAAPKVLWTKQIEGRKTIDNGGKQARTYSSRIMMESILDKDLKETDNVVIRTGDLEGSNQNNRKGGRYLTFQVGVVAPTRAGMTYVQPMTNIQSKLVGLDGTHLVMTTGIFGSAGTPGVAFIQGSHTALAGAPATLRVMTLGTDKRVAVESATGNLGTSYSRHLYENYLGNNPGNQGRNFAKAIAIANPFYGQGGNKDKVLLISAVNGKDVSQAESMYKPSTYISVLPISSDAEAAPQTPGAGNGQGQSGNGDTDADSSIGGCSTGSGSTGLASLLLLGLVAIRRRRA